MPHCECFSRTKYLFWRIRCAFDLRHDAEFFRCFELDFFFQGSGSEDRMEKDASSLYFLSGVITLLIHYPLVVPSFLCYAMATPGSPGWQFLKKKVINNSRVIGVQGVRLSDSFVIVPSGNFLFHFTHICMKYVDRLGMQEYLPDQNLGK